MKTEDWVKVTDKLPEYGEDVLMYNPKDYFHQYYVGYYNSKEFRENEHNSIIRPTYWMPIMPPKN